MQETTTVTIKGIPDDLWTQVKVEALNSKESVPDCVTRLLQKALDGQRRKK